MYQINIENLYRTINLKSAETSLTWVASLVESVVSVCPHLSSPWHLEEDASSASPSHPASSGPSPTLLSAAFSLSHVPALFPSPSLSAGVPAHDDLALSPGPGAVPEGHGHVHVHVPVEMDIHTSPAKSHAIY